MRIIFNMTIVCISSYDTHLLMYKFNILRLLYFMTTFVEHFYSSHIYIYFSINIIATFFAVK